MVDTEIQGYADLWDPSLEDSIALIGNYRVINGITQLAMGRSMNEEDVDVIRETGEKLLELAPNVRLIQDDNTQNALLNGEASVGFLYTSQVTAALAENPDLTVVYPKRDSVLESWECLFRVRLRIRKLLISLWIIS